ncbi:MAG: DUF309 domain-containing protein [Planctomycetota bacterium]
MNYDQHFLDGVRYFNDCDFFEAHEAWEELWTDYQGPSRKFYQGLIQVAVCLLHFGTVNARGAIKLYHSSRAYLEQYPAQYEGVDVAKLLSELERCCAELLASQEEFPQVVVVPDLIPEIHLDPPAN